MGLIKSIKRTFNRIKVVPRKYQKTWHLQIAERYIAVIEVMENFKGI